ncbi:MAG: DUF2283 domain-containing protein [Elusimicrobia bacterium]|nr:DUF2283 domain-containing protein [Elusimicrobiota bacterium]
MAKVSIVYDREGNTLDVWFTKPQKTISEEVGHGVILKKDKRGRILGFEKINFLARGQKIMSKGDLKLEAKVA